MQRKAEKRIGPHYADRGLVDGLVKRYNTVLAAGIITSVLLPKWVEKSLKLPLEQVPSLLILSVWGAKR